MNSSSKKQQNALTNWPNEPSIKDLQNDYKNASEVQEELRANLEHYALIRAGGKALTVKPGKSTTRPKLVRKTNEWKYPALSEPFLNTDRMFEVRPRTFEDGPGAEQNELLLNYQWATKVNKIKLVGDIIRTIVDDGTIVVKSGWKVKKELVKEEQEQPIYASPEQTLVMLEQLVVSGQMSPDEAAAIMENGEQLPIGTEIVEVEVEKLVENHPTYEVCDTSNVLIDPTCEGDIEKAGFVIYEYDTNWAELVSKEYIEDTETGEVSGVYRNLDKVKDKHSGETLYDDFKTDAYNNFKFQDKARKKLRAYEYWGFWDVEDKGVLTPIVATWVNDVLIRLEENPFPHKKLPFSTAQYMPVRKSNHGEPDAAILEDAQEGLGKLIRATHDITAEQAVGQEFIDERLFPGQTQKNAYEKGNTVYITGGIDPKKAIYKKSIEPVPNTVFQMMNMYNADGESLSGTKAFTGGISGNALGDSVGGARSALDAQSKRELDILRRISALFKDMASKTIAMNQAYLEPEQVIRVTNSEFVTIDRDEIAGEYDLIVDVSTPEKDDDKAQKLMTMLQTNQANMDMELQKFFYGQLLKLWKMPDAAKQVEQFQAQPDPMAVQEHEMQMETLRLQQIELQKKIEEADSRIAERVSRAEENELDRINKGAKTERELAMAEYYKSQADKIDQEFVREATGQRRAEHELDKEFDASVKASEQQQARIDKLQELQLKSLGRLNNGKGGLA